MASLLMKFYACTVYWSACRGSSDMLQMQRWCVGGYPACSSMTHPSFQLGLWATRALITGWRSYFGNENSMGGKREMFPPPGILLLAEFNNSYIETEEEDDGLCHPGVNVSKKAGRHELEESKLRLLGQCLICPYLPHFSIFCPPLQKHWWILDPPAYAVVWPSL